jgi:hypothetical protein
VRVLLALLATFVGAVVLTAPRWLEFFTSTQQGPWVMASLMFVGGLALVMAAPFAIILLLFVLAKRIVVSQQAGAARADSARHRDDA